MKEAEPHSPHTMQSCAGSEGLAELLDGQNAAAAEFRCPCSLKLSVQASETALVLSPLCRRDPGFGGYCGAWVSGPLLYQAADLRLQTSGPGLGLGATVESEGSA